MRVEIYVAEDFREYYLARLQAVDLYVSSVNQELFRLYLMPVHKYLLRLNVNNDVLVSHLDAHLFACFCRFHDIFNPVENSRAGG